MSNRSPGGLILPNNSKVEIVEAKARAYHVGGLEVQAPDNPGIILQIRPETLQDPQALLGVLANLLNQLNAVTREVDRLRAHAGLDPWAAGAAPPEQAAAEDDASAKASG